jgi:hypothetical protein
MTVQTRLVEAAISMSVCRTVVAGGLESFIATYGHR